MKGKLKPCEMTPGKEYKGYGWRNEYGEFFFRPAAIGSRAGRIKKIVEDEDFTLSTSNKHIFVKLVFPRAEGSTNILSGFSKVVNKIIAALMKYEI